MSENVLRIRFLSIENKTNQQFSNILLYVKKLTERSTYNESEVILEEKDHDSSIVLSFDQTFDIFPEDQYFQLLFLDSKSNVIDDLILCRKNLLEIVNDSLQDKTIQSELLFCASLERNYLSKFTLQLAVNDNKESKTNRKKPKFQFIKDHIMLIAQFNEPVYCTLCNRFMWGLYHQGYECLLCSLVTHKKCCPFISFSCQKSPKRNKRSKNASPEVIRSHTFQDYNVALVQALMSPSQNYCNHCGSLIRKKGLKCSECSLLIHQHCKMNASPICEVGSDPATRAVGEQPQPIELTRTSNGFSISIKKIISSRLDTSSLNEIWWDSLPKVDLQFLPDFSDFECIGRLGGGSYGKVYYVKHISSGEYFAVKVVDGRNEQARYQFEVERQILFRYSGGNPYMIKPYCTFHQGSNLFLVMEAVLGDNLYHKIQKRYMTEYEVRFYLAEIISVLQYLHSNNIIYRDLKLEHIVLNSDGHIRLVDYGLGRLLKTPDELSYTICGTNGYMAPEVQKLENGLSHDGYSYHIDYWALGIILVQMLCDKYTNYDDPVVLEINNEIKNKKNFIETLKLPPHISEEARSCIKGLLEVDPEKRLGSKNSPHGPIREHPFFNVKPSIEWGHIDENVFKPPGENETIMRCTSDTSVEFPIPALIFDRGAAAKAGWMADGESTCNPDEENQFKSVDHMNEKDWCEAIQSIRL